MESEKETTIYVTGDTIIDHHIYVKEQEISSGYPETVLVSRKGGSEMLFELLDKFQPCSIAEIELRIKRLQHKKRNPELIDKDKDKIEKEIKVLNNTKTLIKKLNIKSEFCLQESEKGKYSPKNFNSFLSWQPYEDKNDKKKISWRIDKKIGFGDYFDASKNKVRYELKKINPDDSDYLIIDDAGLEYREIEQVWKQLLKKDNYKHIILKMSYPVGKGAIFNKLINEKEFAEKLTIITSANELRKSNLKISKGISWEQSLSDLVLEIDKDPSLRNLKKCNNLIVTFSTEGVYYLTGKINNKKSRLIFDNQLLENEYIKEHKKGEVVGYQNVFTACYIAGLQLEDLGKSNIELIIEASLSATRKLAETGHVVKVDNPDFPFEAIYMEIFFPSFKFASSFVPQPEFVTPESFEDWSILKGNYSLEKQTEPLINEAVLHVLDKKKGLINSPQYSVNHFFTVDRKEIEGLRNIKRMVLAYDNNKTDNKPLSIAVFGAPGSGKSFVVKQLEKGMPIDNTSFLEFNLSQFSKPDDIIGALHQVRDEILKGKLPFVFWDEFDSREFMWLQYLLAPMQDGQFQEGQVTHNIGRCIFIFAGGTSYNFERFGYKMPIKPEFKKSATIKERETKLTEYKDELVRFEAFKLRKGPDFKSRLNGYLNVMGPNKEFKYNKDTGVWDIPNNNDVFYPIRRAILFNALSKFDSTRNDIDYSLLNAILRNADEESKKPKYKHGARSFEKVVQSIFQDSNGKMSKSNLPPSTLLDSHVDKDDFLKLLDESNEFELTANKIAPFIHQNWMAAGDKKGWKLEYHKEFNYLPSHIKQDNVEAAKRISLILKNAGYEITDNPLFDKGENFKNEIQKNTKLYEKLAIIEHEGWRIYKESKGWTVGPRNDDKKIHNCIVDFKDLSVKDQNKDKDAVMNIPLVLKNAGLFIKKI